MPAIARPMATHPTFPAAGSVTGGAVDWLLRRVRQMIQARRSRAELRELDDRLLLDVGLTRAEADAECERPFWDVQQLR